MSSSTTWSGLHLSIIEATQYLVFAILSVLLFPSEVHLPNLINFPSSNIAQPLVIDA
jgi:hypothetical protein